jgi:NAD(P)-dependent dehydrogenase (short-subunit alcohol dehydrogenase family)
MKRALVVGATRGLGLELTKGLLARGWEVSTTSRKDAPALAELGCKVASGVELLEDKCGDVLVAGTSGVFDQVYMNAGYFYTGETFDVLNFEEERKMFEICAIAPLRIIQALVKGGRLVSGSKIILITSEGGSIGLRTEEEGGGHYGHHMSKAAENMMGRLLAWDLKPRGIAVVMVHPGFLRTEMTEHYSHLYDKFGAVPASEAVAPILKAGDDVTLETTGRFIAPLGADGLGLGASALPKGFKPFDDIPW